MSRKKIIAAFAAASLIALTGCGANANIQLSLGIWTGGAVQANGVYDGSSFAALRNGFTPPPGPMPKIPSPGRTQSASWRLCSMAPHAKWQTR